MCIPEDNTFYVTESVFGNKELYLIIRREAACYIRPAIPQCLAAKNN